jgi:hypothetical protein
MENENIVQSNIVIKMSKIMYLVYKRWLREWNDRVIGDGRNIWYLILRHELSGLNKQDIHHLRKQPWILNEKLKRRGWGCMKSKKIKIRSCIMCKKKKNPENEMIEIEKVII